MEHSTLDEPATQQPNNNMKSEPLSCWSIIRWASVCLIYAGTIAIAVDQVKTKDGELMVAEGKLAKQRVALGRLANDAVDLGKDVAGIAAAHQQSQEQLVAIQSQMRLLEAMRKTDVAVKNHWESQAVPAVAPVARPHYPPVTTSPAVAALPAPVVAEWTPPAPSVLARHIREKAISEWKDDYQMVNHVIETQGKGYQEVLGYYKTGNRSIKDVLNKAAREWPGDYTMMAHTIKSQLEAKAKFDRQ